MPFTLEGPTKRVGLLADEGWVSPRRVEGSAKRLTMPENTAGDFPSETNFAKKAKLD
jgi:hypothetical protein